MSAPDAINERLGELIAAFALLTRLPVGRLDLPAPQDPAASAWAFPLVGAATGLIGGLTYALLFALSVPPLLAGLFAIAAMIVITGAMHEDGLADAADGLAGQTREQRLDIMRDSRIGTYGVLALILSIGIRASALALLAEPGLVAAALVTAMAASRASATTLMAA
jgi:adenosylcobinamide-GDP ribazoletransferase